MTRETSKTPSVGDALQLAAPASLAAMATPLLGVADVWILGHSSRPLDIAAVGLGSVVFSLIYWTFGFIRMSVAGLTAQSVGANDIPEVYSVLFRGLALGTAIGLSLTLLQWPIGILAFSVMELDTQASTDTLSAAKAYFGTRIWAAPFAIATYAFFGWLSAQRRTDLLMVASLSMTFLNIALNWLFVYQFNMGASGVALGTAFSEAFGFALSGAFSLYLMRHGGGVGQHFSVAKIVERSALARTLVVNRDIFIRTLLLSISFAWFTQRSGTFGDTTLAANQILLQMFLFTGLALDGTAIAAETLIGQATGTNDPRDYSRQIMSAIKATSMPALFLAVVFWLSYWLFGQNLAGAVTKDAAIYAAS
ncbi:MAG: MATE family efflux transporter, partial [Pseudomonadota bacterium]